MVRTAVATIVMSRAASETPSTSPAVMAARRRGVRGSSTGSAVGSVAIEASSRCGGPESCGHRADRPSATTTHLPPARYPCGPSGPRSPPSCLPKWVTTTDGRGSSGPQAGRHTGEPTAGHHRRPTPEDTMTPTTPRGPVLTLVAMLGLALTLVLVNGATTRDAAAVPVAAAPAAVTAAADPAPPVGRTRTCRAHRCTCRRGRSRAAGRRLPRDGEVRRRGADGEGPDPDRDHRRRRPREGLRLRRQEDRGLAAGHRGGRRRGAHRTQGRPAVRDAHRRRGRGHRGAGRISRVDVLRRADDEHPCRARPGEGRPPPPPGPDQPVHPRRRPP